MTVEGLRVASARLDLREPADAAARSRALVERLRERLPAAGARVVHDLASGTGSMGRWLAPLLPGRQRWILHDRDADLLRIAATRAPAAAADGAGVSVETRESDITRLTAADLAGASLVTASALLDMLTADDLAAFVAVCCAPRCPVLVTLSVVGRVALRPQDPLDARIAAAFDAHQRRPTVAGRLLGPDAVKRAVDGFRGRGAEVLVRPSPWRLGPAEAALAAEWLEGFIGAACEQEPALARAADGYTRHRLAEARAGRLAVMVDHADLLVLP